MHEIQRPAGGFVAWKMCENTHTMDAPGCAGEASMCPGTELGTENSQYIYGGYHGRKSGGGGGGAGGRVPPRF